MTQLITSPVQSFKASIFPKEREAALVNLIDSYRDTKMAALEKFVQKYPVTITGKFYQRPVSENGINFHYPDESCDPYCKVFAWSRILDDVEILCVINLDHNSTARIYVTIYHNIHPIGSKMFCLYGTNECPEELNVEVRNGKSIRMTVPAGEIVCYGIKSE